MATAPVPEMITDEGVLDAASRRRADSRWHHFLFLLRESWMLRIGVGIVAVAVFLAIFGPMLAPHSTEDASGPFLASPGGEHWFGTDASGLDVFSRTIASPRIDVTIALLATIISLVGGTLIGLLASFTRGRGGSVVMWISDAFQASPLFVLAVVFVVTAGQSVPNIIVVIAVLQFPIYLRLVRGEVISLRERTFVEAARANGDRSFSIAVRHILPNSLTPAFAQAPITFGFSILMAAGLSFIGAGVRPPAAEWGAMIGAGRSDLILGVWWTSVFPGIALSLTVFGFAIVGSAIQTIVDRKS